LGYDIPKLGKDPDAVVVLTNPIIKGKVDMQATVNDSTAINAISADLNLIAGMAAAGITLVKCLTKTVSCTTGTAVVTSIGIIPVGSVILSVSTLCTVALNGATTTTFEVGIAGNTDKYIDPVDCPVTLAGVWDMSIAAGSNDQKLLEVLPAALTLQSVHTNTTHAGAVLGTIVVKVIYI
jgi:hypothetical protein